MKKQLLHTPEGVRDIYNEECEKKLLLQSDLLGILKSFPIANPIKNSMKKMFLTV